MATLTTELLVLCDQAIVSSEGKLSIIGIFNQIFASTFPTHLHNLFIVAIFTGTPGSKHQLTLEITSQQGKNITTRKVDLSLGQNGKSNFVAGLQGLPLPSAGTYKIQFIETGSTITTKDFQVIKVSPQKSASKLPN